MGKVFWHLHTKIQNSYSHVKTPIKKGIPTYINRLNIKQEEDIRI